MSKKAKNILFRADLEGKGIVNYDSKEQKYLFHNSNLKHLIEFKDNVSFAKKHITKNSTNGDLDYKVIISSDCLRHDIFKGDVLNQSPNVMHHEALLYSFLASPAAILRGYTFTKKGGNLKRKSPITLIDAIQTNDSLSKLEFFSRSGSKNEDDDITDNIIFKKETVGDMKYKSIGSIDLMQLQFVSASLLFDRYAFNPDFFETYKKIFNTRLKNFNSELGYYNIVDSIMDLPEYGFLFSNENINDLVKDFFKRLARLNICRKNAYAKTSSIEYKIVYDVLEDTYDNEDGWIKIGKESDIEKLKFDTEIFYKLENPIDSVKKISELDENLKKYNEDNKAKKAEEKAKKDAKKSEDKDKKDAKKSEDGNNIE